MSFTVTVLLIMYSDRLVKWQESTNKTVHNARTWMYYYTSIFNSKMFEFHSTCRFKSQHHNQVVGRVREFRGCPFSKGRGLAQRIQSEVVDSHSAS
jgi:hypothetical protein